MVRNILLLAASGGARDHRWTLEEGITREEMIRRGIDPAKADDLLRKYGIESGGRVKIYAWGMVDTLKSTWDRLNPDDHVLVHYGKRDGGYRYYARIMGKIHDPDFAEKIWGHDDQGRTWEYVFFLTEPEEVGLPTEEVHRTLGYAENYILYGSTLVSDEKLRRIESEYGSVDEFIRELIGGEVEMYGKMLTRGSTGRTEWQNMRDVILDIYADLREYAIDLMEKGENIILYGPPGSGKTVLAKELAQEYSDRRGGNGYILYTVHSGTDYFDLVARIIPEVDETGRLHYRRETRYLLDALLNRKVLILDEINRTQIDTALGPFFTYLEYHHRREDAENIASLIQKETRREHSIDELAEKLEFFRVIGTLNTYDRTFLFKLGDALRRRFKFVEITTTEDVLDTIESNYDGFLKAIGYGERDSAAERALEIFRQANGIKELGIGLLKDILTLAKSVPNERIDSVDWAVSGVIVPLFEGDISSRRLDEILSANGLETSRAKLRRLNRELFGE